MINLTNQNENSFEVTISTLKRSFEKGEDIKLQMTVKNLGNQTEQFCDYHTPFEGVKNNIFTVFRGKNEIPYQGMMKKRIPPSKENYKTLQAGKSSKCTVLLSGYDLSKKGTYTISFTGNLVSGLPASNTIELQID